MNSIKQKIHDKGDNMQSLCLIGESTTAKCISPSNNASYLPKH